jgi:hypothetical protein
VSYAIHYFADVACSFIIIEKNMLGIFPHYTFNSFLLNVSYIAKMNTILSCNLAAYVIKMIQLF